jgi:hypothetical protein
LIILFQKNESEERKMSSTVDPQGSKDGHQEAYQDSPSIESGVFCAGACCTAKNQLLNQDNICCGCFKIVHVACYIMIDEYGNTLCAACDTMTKPQGKSDGSSSATETEQEEDEDDHPDPPRPVLWSATMLESPVESPTATSTRTSWTRAATATAITLPWKQQQYQHHCLHPLKIG